jgi:hypothetical protein
MQFRQSQFGPTRTSMFFLFSNRLGCLGSIVVSAGATIVLLVLFGILRF